VVRGDYAGNPWYFLSVSKIFGRFFLTGKCQKQERDRFFYIIIIIVILLIIRVIKVNFEIYEWQHIVVLIVTSLNNVSLTLASLATVDVDPTVMDHNQDEQTHH
jgi:hypothetical protein